MPAAITDFGNVFENIPVEPCGTLVMISNDAPNGTLCLDGISVERTYTLFDDLNGNQTLDAGEESATCVKSFNPSKYVIPFFISFFDVL